MKFAFEVWDRPGLFKVLQHKAIRLGKTWPASTWVEGIVPKDLCKDDQFFKFDLCHHFFQCIKIYEPARQLEDQLRQRSRDELAQQGYRFDLFEEFFGLEEPQADYSLLRSARASASVTSSYTPMAYCFCFPAIR